MKQFKNIKLDYELTEYTEYTQLDGMYACINKPNIIQVSRLTIEYSKLYNTILYDRIRIDGTWDTRPGVHNYTIPDEYYDVMLSIANNYDPSGEVSIISECKLNSWLIYNNIISFNMASHGRY